MADAQRVGNASSSGARARIFAFTLLTLLVAGVGYVGREGYLAATDSFVAPIILTPDNDQVLSTKLHASQLAVERARTAAEIEAAEEAIAAGEKAIARLKGLQRPPETALAWTSNMSARQLSNVASERKVLAAQYKVLADMAAKQARLVDEGRTNLAAGLISQVDFTKELQTQNQLRLAMLDNERTRLQTGLQLQQAALTRRSIAGEGPATPEMLMREEQMVRVELEIMKLESEQRSKEQTKKLLTEKLTTLDEVRAKIETRPIFRAAETSLDVAFVPYTQIDGVDRGASVYACIWGVFHCKPVGKVAELVPGEVILPDPWGNQARGQYAVLELDDRRVAKAKTLRVRGGAAPPRVQEPEPERISSR